MDGHPRTNNGMEGFPITHQGSVTISNLTVTESLTSFKAEESTVLKKIHFINGVQITKKHIKVMTGKPKVPLFEKIWKMSRLVNNFSKYV